MSRRTEEMTLVLGAKIVVATAVIGFLMRLLWSFFYNSGRGSVVFSVCTGILGFAALVGVVLLAVGLVIRK